MVRAGRGTPQEQGCIGNGSSMLGYGRLSCNLVAIAALCFSSLWLPKPQWRGELRRLSVFGEDDRRELVITERPWSAIGRIELLPRGANPSSYDGSIPFCTGALVARDLVLTNAHCVLDAKTNRLTQQGIWFHPGTRDSSQTQHATRAVKVWLGSLTPNTHRTADWALLRLAKPLGDSMGWLEVRPFPSADLPVDTKVATTFVGYAMDYANGRSPSIQTSCAVTSFDPRGPYLRHNCDMNAGSSGGPLLWYDKGVPYIIAVNAAHMSKEKVSHFADFTPELANVAVGSEHFHSLIAGLMSTQTGEEPGNTYALEVPTTDEVDATLPTTATHPTGLAN